MLIKLQNSSKRENNDHNIERCAPYVVVTVLDEEVQLMRSNDRRLLGNNMRAYQQYWYHETWCGQRDQPIPGKHQTYAGMESAFTFSPQKSNAAFIFGGVSGKQVVVFSVFHSSHGNSNNDADCNSASSCSQSGSAANNTSGVSNCPTLLGQAVVYMSHRGTWFEGFNGVIPLQDSDEVSETIERIKQSRLSIVPFFFKCHVLDVVIVSCL